MSDAKLRRSAEEIFAEELAALKRGDDRPRPENWLLSPPAVVTYSLGRHGQGRYRDLGQVCRQPAAH
jgi:hypothetical protein